MAEFLNMEQLADMIADRIRDIKMQRLYALEQAAAYLGLTPTALRHKVANGKIPTVDIDSRPRFDRQDLDDYIDKNKSKGKAA